jgi:hypothetical protein
VNRFYLLQGSTIVGDVAISLGEISLGADQYSDNTH